jgi:hypothetical protein
MIARCPSCHWHLKLVPAKRLTGPQRGGFYWHAYCWNPHCVRKGRMVSPEECWTGPR